MSGHGPGARGQHVSQRITMNFCLSPGQCWEEDALGCGKQLSSGLQHGWGGSALHPWPRAGPGTKPLCTQRAVGVSLARLPMEDSPREPRHPARLGSRQALGCEGSRSRRDALPCTAQHPRAHSGFLSHSPEKMSSRALTLPALPKKHQGKYWGAASVCSSRGSLPEP